MSCYRFKSSWYAGKTPASLPGIDDPKSEFEAANNYTKKLGFRFEPSGVPGNHWSNITTMKSYVRNVLSVYFNKKVDPQTENSSMSLDSQLLFSSSLAGIPQLDAGKLPWILVRYVPGGCTGVFQPCDVGIQQILKHAMKETALSHIAKETVTHLTNNKDPGTSSLPRLLGFSGTDRLSGW